MAYGETCWERHGYVQWGIMEGILMTHEDSKILRTMTMMKTDDSNDSHDSNSSKDQMKS